MAKESAIISAFSGGEWDIHLYGRTDIETYSSACREMENFIPLSQGPAVRRPGTVYIATTKNQGKVRLIPFEFSTEQAYVLEVGAYYIRFYKDRGQIQSGINTPVEIITPYGEEDLADLRWTQSADILYLVHPKYAPRKLSRQSHVSWTLTIMDPRDGPYIEQNGTTTTLAPAAVSGSNIAINASTPVFLSTDVGRAIRIRHNAVWGWAKITAVNNDKQVLADVKSNFGAVSAVTTWRLGAWSETTGWPGCITFMQDRLFFARTKSQPQTIWGSVVSDYERFSTTEYDGTVLDSTGLQFTISDDRVNAVSWMSASRNMIIGSSGGEFIMETTNDGPITPFNASVKRDTTVGSALFQPVRVDRAVIYIQRAARKLHHLSYSSDSGGLITKDLSTLAPHLSNLGLRQLVYQRVPWSVLWAVTDNGALLGLTYDPEKDVAAWHRHQLGGAVEKVVSIIVIPNPIQDEVWIIVRRLIDGVVVQYLEVMDNEFSPVDEFDIANAVFLDCSVPFNGKQDANLSIKTEETRVIFYADSPVFRTSHVGREIHYRYKKGSENYHVSKAEIIRFIDDQSVEAVIRVPFPLGPFKGWSIATRKIGGLMHLKKETVSVLADGATHPDCLVSEDGEIQLSRQVACAQIGFNYKSKLVTMDIDAGALDGTAQGKNKRISSLVVRFKQSLGCLAGGASGPLERINFREGTTRMDQSPPLFSGDKIVTLADSWSRKATVTIIQDQPLPCSVVALIPQIITMDG